MIGKTLMVALATGLLALLPGNGIGCAGDEPDAWDYYTSFFSPATATNDLSLRPFFYTELAQYYDDDSGTTLRTTLLREWKSYTQGTPADVAALVYDFDASTLADLAAGKTSEAATAALRGNATARALERRGARNVFDYLHYARRCETFSAPQDWDDAAPADTTDLGRLSALFAARSRTANAFLAPRWRLLCCKADFYGGNFAACVQHYDEAFAARKASTVQALALSYKAGSLYHLGRKREAALAYSRVFSALPGTRQLVYTGFRWSSGEIDARERAAWLSGLPNRRERANLLALFLLYGGEAREADLAQLYKLAPDHPLLPLLTAREIAKAEENYLSPTWQWSKSLFSFQYFSEPTPEDRDKVKAYGTHIDQLAALLPRLAARNPRQAAFYEAGKAWLDLMRQRYDAAGAAIAKARAAAPSKKITEQLHLLDLLLLSEAPRRIDARVEARLLPAARWLTTKAAGDRQWSVFCRNYFNDVLGRRYARQGNAARTALCIGVADRPYPGDYHNPSYYNWGAGTDYLQVALSAASLKKLAQLQARPATAWERFLVQKAAFEKRDLIEAAGTACIREERYPEAVRWLQQLDSLPPLTASSDYLYNGGEATYVDPFFSYLNDWQRFDTSPSEPFTKLTLARALRDLERGLAQAKSKEEKARLLFRIATARYNMSFYGNSWMVNVSYRSGGNWEYGRYDNRWQQEYFEPRRVRALFEQAFAASGDPEFRAACLFQVAKCIQRGAVGRAQPIGPWGREVAYGRWFYQNPVFPRLQKEFGQTRFYQEALSRCSYLRDFVTQQSK